jgi:hypothetical protein
MQLREEWQRRLAGSLARLLVGLALFLAGKDVVAAASSQTTVVGGETGQQGSTSRIWFSWSPYELNCGYLSPDELPCGPLHN